MFRRNFFPAEDTPRFSWGKAAEFVPKWFTEFGPHYRPPVWVLSLVGHGILEDTSWRTGSGASFVLPGREQDLVIFVEHEDPEERDSSEWTPGMGFIGSGPRYALYLTRHEPSDVQGQGREIETVQLWSGDDEDEMRDVFFAKRFELGF